MTAVAGLKGAAFQKLFSRLKASRSFSVDPETFRSFSVNSETFRSFSESSETVQKLFRIFRNFSKAFQKLFRKVFRNVFRKVFRERCPEKLLKILNSLDSF